MQRSQSSPATQSAFPEATGCCTGLPVAPQLLALVSSLFLAWQRGMLRILSLALAEACEQWAGGTSLTLGGSPASQPLLGLRSSKQPGCEASHWHCCRGSQRGMARGWRGCEPSPRRGCPHRGRCSEGCPGPAPRRPRCHPDVPNAPCQLLANRWARVPSTGLGPGAEGSGPRWPLTAPACSADRAEPAAAGLFSSWSPAA